MRQFQKEVCVLSQKKKKKKEEKTREICNKTGMKVHEYWILAYNNFLKSEASYHVIVEYLSIMGS